MSCKVTFDFSEGVGVELSGGRLVGKMAGKVKMVRGTGRLRGLYADFERVCDKGKV